MTAYNVVRIKVKPGKDKEVMDYWKSRADAQGRGQGALIKTGDRTYCFIGEWDSMDSIVAARPQMIASSTRCARSSRTSAAASASPTRSRARW